jgi:hypothetical protein
VFGLTKPWARALGATEFHALHGASGWSSARYQSTKIRSAEFVTGDISMSSSTPEQATAAQPASTVYRVPLTKVSSFLIITQRRTATYRGTLDQLEGFARNVRTHNLVLGWWGVPAGLIWTPMALAQNAKAMRQLRDLAARG